MSVDLNFQTNAADFEAGNSEELSITDASQTGLDITGDLSTSCWVKVESDPSGTHIIAGKSKDDSDDRSWYLAYVENSGKKIRFLTNNTGAPAGNAIGDISQTLTAGTWYHICSVYDASAGSCVIYVNGSSIGTIGSLKTSLYNGDAPFQLGATTGGSGTSAGFFDGLIDQFGIWSKTLTGTEVTALYNSGLGIEYATVAVHGTLPTSLVSYWELGEASGTRDDSKASNDLADGNTVLSGIGAIQTASGTFPIATSIQVPTLTATGEVFADTFDIAITLQAPTLATIEKLWTNQSKTATTWVNEIKT